MSEEKNPVTIIHKHQADGMNCYAQSLDDEITHVVDYGKMIEQDSDPKETDKDG